MSYSIVITDCGFPDNLIEEEVLRREGIPAKINWSNEEELIRETRSADALLVQWAPITSRVIHSLERCKVIVRYGIGIDNIDLKAAADKGIPVCNVPDYCIDEVADHTLSLALAALRQIPETDRRTREGNWKITLPRPVAPFSMLSFGLAGFGRIARKVAEKAMGLGFKVKAADPFVMPDAMEALGITPLDIEALVKEADVLSLHLPFNPGTHHFLGQRRLDSMKKSAIVVNTSRGGLVDTIALAKALSEDRLGGAALDVFETEPITEAHPILSAPRVILSSHVAWYSTQSIPLLQRKAAEEIGRALTGQPLQHSILIKK